MFAELLAIKPICTPSSKHCLLRGAVCWVNALTKLIPLQLAEAMRDKFGQWDLNRSFRVWLLGKIFKGTKRWLHSPFPLLLSHEHENLIPPSIPVILQVEQQNRKKKKEQPDRIGYVTRENILLFAYVVSLGSGDRQSCLTDTHLTHPGLPSQNSALIWLSHHLFLIRFLTKSLGYNFSQLSHFCYLPI